MVTFHFLSITVTVSWRRKDPAERVADDMRIARIMEEITDKRAEYQRFI